MSRSVSVPSGAISVFYAAYEGDEDAWDWSLEGFCEDAKAKYPSLEDVYNRWLGREDHVLLENCHCLITLSEYNGIVAASVVPKTSFSRRWCEGVDLSNAVAYFGSELRAGAVFSNGEKMFSPAKSAPKGDLGLGYSSKEGWL